ncbi:MAG TPA: hypothetical protein VK745_01135 [Polyangiaceae bacterium]|jgi:hypothetical protein|nr:hypothetical protein [Polyangiaceae bacterium]
MRFLLRSCGLLGVWLGCAWPRIASAEASIYHESVPTPPHVSDFTLPLEWGDSAVWGRGRPGPLYEFEAGLLPGFLLWDTLGLHAKVEYHYRNPGSDIGLGGRASCVVVPAVAGFVPVTVFTGWSYLPHANTSEFEAGASFGLGKLFYLALSGGYEADRRSGVYHMAFGIDLNELSDPIGSITHFVPEKVP